MVMEVNNFSFSFPNGKEPILNEVNLQIEAGSFQILCGPSGCGKTTLFRCMKKQIAPEGSYQGTITELAPSECGFVFQNPDNQIVTDTVRHELAFGLENMGLPTANIRQRVAETALFFGIDEWIDSSVHEISGGQKQLLNLASVIAMRPKLLLLDEPTSQLDPVARKTFLEILLRVNRELGIAVFLSEHHLEEVLPLADTVFYMEEGRLLFSGDAEAFCFHTKRRDLVYEKALPSAVRLSLAENYLETEGKAELPLTVREGMIWATKNKDRLQLGAIQENATPEKDICLTAEQLWFQYEKRAPFVLKGLSLEIRRGEIHMVIGGNGSGKTTLLSSLSKRCYPQRGKIRLGKDKKMPGIGLLPQNPKAMFSKDTVWEELVSAYGNEKTAEEAAEQVGLCKTLSQHPYDLSGGEQQRLGLSLVLADAPELLLLDEPGKGLDPLLKEELGVFLKDYAEKGNAILCVTHDTEFAARFGDVVSLLFEGEVLVTQSARTFFEGNAFFTTDMVRILRNILPGAVLREDVIFV